LQTNPTWNFVVNKAQFPNQPSASPFLHKLTVTTDRQQFDQLLFILTAAGNLAAGWLAGSPASLLPAFIAQSDSQPLLPARGFESIHPSSMLLPPIPPLRRLPLIGSTARNLALI
jgi:hypothetical protein